MWSVLHNGAMVIRTLLTLCLFAAFLVPVCGQDANSEDPKERAKAARSLADQGSAALPALGKLLKDPEVKVRREAVESIVKVGTLQSLDYLIEAARDTDMEVQVWAADGMVNFYLPGYVKTGFTASFRKASKGIKGRFTDTNDQVIPPGIRVREDVIVALGKLARGGVGMPSRANAARALGILRGRAAVPDLLEAIKSKDSAVLYESLIALQKIRDKSAAPGIDHLLRDLDDRVQIAAVETVGLLQYHDALPRLYDVLASARNNKIQRAALTAIAMLPDEKSRVYFNQYIVDKDPLTRAAAAEGFGRLGNQSDTRMLQTYFGSEKKMNPRLSLAFALVLLGQNEYAEFSPLQYLINTLNSGSFRGVAEPFLVEAAREPKVREGIYQALSRGTSDEKVHLCRVLGRSGAGDSIPHLENLVKDTDAKVATEASRALRLLRARVQ